MGRLSLFSMLTQTVNLASINRSALTRLPIPIPPVAEQRKIMHEVARQLSAADKLLATLDRQLSRARAARDVLLREAFTGRLVPQNPKDEPASILLERIRVLSKIEAQKPKGKRMRKSTSKASRRPLIDVLRAHKKPMTPEQLFRDAGFKPGQVDLFYRELGSLRHKLKEHKPKASEVKSWPYRVQVKLELQER